MQTLFMLLWICKDRTAVSQKVAFKLVWHYYVAMWYVLLFRKKSSVKYALIQHLMFFLLQPFVESLSKCPKHGLHNPLKAPERSVVFHPPNENWYKCIGFKSFSFHGLQAQLVLIIRYQDYLCFKKIQYAGTWCMEIYLQKLHICWANLRYALLILNYWTLKRFS
jgi:hypothetical protein